MKLAEALAARKDANANALEAFRERAQEVLTYEEGDSPDDQAGGVFLDDLDRRYDEIAELSVAINRTNNDTPVDYQGETMTMMEAVALRDAMFGKISALDRIIREVSDRTTSNRYRSRDDAKVYPVIPLSDLRDRKNTYEADLRRLDNAIQSVNWTVDLSE